MSILLLTMNKGRRHVVSASNPVD